MKTILGCPDKMLLNLKFRMTALAIFHANNYKPAASRMLPAFKAGFLTEVRNNNHMSNKHFAINAMLLHKNGRGEGGSRSVFGFDYKIIAKAVGKR